MTRNDDGPGVTAPRPATTTQNADHQHRHPTAETTLMGLVWILPAVAGQRKRGAA